MELQVKLRDSPSKINGALNDKEKGKKKDRKENKKDKSENSAPATPEIPSSGTPASTGEPSNVGVSGSTPEVFKDVDDSKSPGDGSTGARTPKSGKPPRHPWTIFMRMTPQMQVTEAEIRDFFGEAKDGITRVNLPHNFPGKAKLAYVEFGDEEALKAGLDKHEESLKDTVPEVKQAVDREQRGEQSYRGFRGRRGGLGNFATRGLLAAGLTRGGHRGNGEVNRGGDSNPAS